ncbi:nucleotide exchange factor GrpE [Buchnera aphidicola (Taiwanaphis decaspermi)]|uniref:nucleotide exchange factor GrpE n=1 Tax=Buchnera aphidicola TaxID=9 RepID=UPI0031B846FA
MIEKNKIKLNYKKKEIKKNKENLKKKISKEKIKNKKEMKLFEKIIKKDIINASLFSLEKKIIELLNIVDNLEKCIESFSIKKKENVKINKYLKNIMNEFLKLLKNYNVIPVNDILVTFDPGIHQAISITKITKNKISSNTVIEIFQKGYILNNRLLRPALVKVYQ